MAGFDGSTEVINGPAISGSSSNFGLFLHDNLQVTVNLYNDSGDHRMKLSSDGITFYFAATIKVTCSSYYITHIAMKDHNGTAIEVFDPSLPQQTNFSFDLNVDIDKSGASGAPSTITDYHARTASSPTTIKTITITYDTTPRSYAISYTNAVNGQNGVTNGNRKTYNVTTADFTITAPTRTGYTLSGMTYTDAQHTTATAATLPMTISRGDAATRKEIKFTASWTNPTGTCGDNATWVYDHATRTLSITGTGGTDNFSYGNRPWEQYKDYITTVSIGDGITSIGSSAFSLCSNLANITGGDDLINVNSNAFYDTQWYNTAINDDIVNYIGRIAYIGSGISGDVTLADGTIAIAEYAFNSNSDLYSVTIPASVASIGDIVFMDCTALSTVNVLAATPPTLGGQAFYLNSPYTPLARTFNVRSADYKTAAGWTDIYNKLSLYSDHRGFSMRVVSTLALPDGVAARADATDKVTAYGTTYYAEDATITLIGLGTEHTAGGITYRRRATVTAEDFPYAVKYIDASGSEKTCTNFTIINAGTTSLSNGWFVVTGDITLSSLNGNSNINLILCDGATLTLQNSTDMTDIYMTGSGSIAIYGQTEGTGTLNANLIYSSRYIDINGGIINARLQNDARDRNSGIRIRRGTVNATTSNSQTAINISEGLLEISGGTVTATSTGSAIYVGGNFTMTGGSLTAEGTGSTAINVNEGITINGGTLSVCGTNNAIFAYYGVTISGGNVSATSTDGNGIDATGNITLGWKNAEDRIYVSSYKTIGSISVITGQTLYNGTETLSGTIYDRTYPQAPIGDLSNLNDKTLMGVDILLDDDSAQPDGSKNADRIAALAADGKKHNIMLQGRTLHRDGGWNTLCLPFTVKFMNDISNVTTNEDHVFHGATVMYLNTNDWFDSEGYYYHGEANGRHRSGEVDADGSLYLYFEKTLDVNEFHGDIAAGCPYIVKWGTKADHPATHIVNPVFQGVTVTSTNPYFDTTKEGRDAQTGIGNVTFRGTFAPISYAAANHSILFLGEDNTLYYPEAGAHIGPFRAYFELGNGLTAGEPSSTVRGFNLNFSEDSSEATIISPAEIKEIKERADAWYTIDGRKLDKEPTKPGLYIYKGKKVKR